MAEDKVGIGNSLVSLARDTHPIHSICTSDIAECRHHEHPKSIQREMKSVHCDLRAPVVVYTLYQQGGPPGNGLHGSAYNRINAKTMTSIH